MTTATMTPVMTLLSRPPMVRARCIRRLRALSPVLGGAATDGHPVEPVGQHALLGAPDDPVDEPVQQPAHDQADEDEPDDRQRLADQYVRQLGRLLVAGPVEDVVARPLVREAGVGRERERRGQGEHGLQYVETSGADSLAPVTKTVLRTLAVIAVAVALPLTYAAAASADVPEGWSDPDDVAFMHALLVLGGIPLRASCSSRWRCTCRRSCAGESVAPAGVRADDEWFGGSTRRRQGHRGAQERRR